MSARNSVMAILPVCLVVGCVDEHPLRDRWPHAILPLGPLNDQIALQHKALVPARVVDMQNESDRRFRRGDAGNCFGKTGMMPFGLHQFISLRLESI